MWPISISSRCGEIDGDKRSNNDQNNYRAQRPVGIFVHPWPRGDEPRVFFSDDIVWSSCKYGAGEHVPSWRQMNEMTVAYVTAVA